MNHQEKYNAERYLDMTAYLAIKNIERDERMQRTLREDWEFHRGDLYIADLGTGAVGFRGAHVQGGVRPVVLLQNNTGNFFSPTLIVVPITSKVWKKPSLPTHYLIRQTIALCLVCGLTVGAIDETIQVFSDRGAQASDVLLDFVGAAAGILSVTVIAWIVRTVRQRRRKDVPEQ